VKFMPGLAVISTVKIPVCVAICIPAPVVEATKLPGAKASED